jgi:predicted MFS family arabinose efflux permease
LKKRTEKKLFTKDYILLMLSGLAISFGYSMIAPLITSYGTALGAGLTAAGALTGVFSIAALVIRPFGGYASDVLKKRNICIFSTFLIAIAMLGYSIAPGIKTMFAVRILHGIAFGIQGTVNIAILYEFLPKERLAEGIAYYSLGQVISQVFGPGLGIEIRNQYGYKQLFWITAIITFIAIAFVLFTDKEISKEERVTEPKKDRSRFSFGSMIALPCIVYALIGGLFSLENGVVNSFLVLVAEERNISGISMFFTINAAVLFVIRMAVGKIVDKHSITLIVNISLVTSVIAMLTLGGGKSLWILLVAAAFKAVGQGTGQISLQTACMKKVEATKVGIATSTFYIGADLGQGLGPIIGGELSERLGYTAMFYCIAILIAISLIGFNFYQKKEAYNLKEE